jgi:SAM-dependent methyltransferase
MDHRHIEWSQKNLAFMHSSLTSVRSPLPYADNMFDAIISISIFTHLNESSQDQFLTELHLISRAGGHLFLTVHGERALHRAITEEPIRAMISVEDDAFQNARASFSQGNHAFILQHGHLTTASDMSSKIHGEKLIDEAFEYGITFILESYIHSHWSQWSAIQRYCRGAIHDFQDIVVCTRAHERRMLRWHEIAKIGSA